MGRVENEMKETVEQISGNTFKQLANSCLKVLFVTDPSVDRKVIETRKDKLIERSCDWSLPQLWEFLKVTHQAGCGYTEHLEKERP
jgi:hypothetical protein